MEAEDYGFYQGLVYLLEHDIDDLGYELTFSAEVFSSLNLLVFIVVAIFLFLTHFIYLKRRDELIC